MQEYHKKVTLTTLERPGDNVDRKPIENQWDYMKNKIADKEPAKALVNTINDILIPRMSAEYCQAHSHHALKQLSSCAYKILVYIDIHKIENKLLLINFMH